MTDDPAPDGTTHVKSQRVQHRERRLKAALKANMAKRKAQGRARADQASEPAGDADHDNDTA